MWVGISVNTQLYRGWPLGQRKPGIVPVVEGLVEAAGESIEIRGVGFYWGVGVGTCEGDSATVVDLCDEAFRGEAVGFRESDSSYLGEGGSNGLSYSVGSGVASGSEEASSGQGEGRLGCHLIVPISHYLCSRGSFLFLLSSSWARAGCFRIGLGGCRSVVRVVGGSGKQGQVILVDTELFRFPRV